MTDQKYQTMYDLFKIMYKLYKLTNPQKHFDFCYCNIKATCCWLCSFVDYMKFNSFGERLLRFRESAWRLLDLADKVWFYIRKIKKDMERLNIYDSNSLDFFFLDIDCGEMCFVNVIEEDIIEYEHYVQNIR